MMKTKNIIAILFSLAAIGCEREGSIAPSVNQLTGSVCKEHGFKTVADQASDQDCINYSWRSGDTLIIKHVNAAFNCCPGGFHAGVRIVGDTVILTEKENSSLCDCNCLFDLSCKLGGISKGTWWIRIEEPYIQNTSQEKILFKAELKKNSDGEYCISRSGYPWRP
jgi:hypothetical protein